LVPKVSPALSPANPLLLGHRGAWRERAAPENTVAAFDLALGAGCDGFEFDVRLSSDGKAVVCHDAAVHGNEIAHASAEELGLPLLSDVLQRYQRSAFLDIELKVPGLETNTLALLRKYPPVCGYVISSFLPGALKKIRGSDANIPLGLICESESQLGLWSSVPVQYVIPHHKLMRRTRIAELQRNGKKVIVWTVNSVGDMERLAKWGVDGVVSDKPELLVRMVGAKRANLRIGC
jgi:glycerophosphoryl diester phosphodiesterase